MRRRPVPLAVSILALVLTACATGNSTGPSGSSSSSGLDPTAFALQVASTDIAAGDPSRVEVGVVWSDQTQGVQLLTSGTIALMLRPYQGGTGTPMQGDARYVPAPGTQGDASGAPVLTSPDVGRGVYELDEVMFDAAGIWEAEATFSVGGGSPITLTSQFEVLSAHALPAPGDEALRTRNLTIDTAKDLQAVDSRAQDGAAVPDPELHAETIAGALAEGRPVLVLFATPVYCQSQFCGPTTDALQQMAADGPPQVAFIHVEIWNDYSTSAINRAAADWLLRKGDLTEPWLFLIDGDGTIVDRWGPLFDPAQVRAELDAL